MFSSEIYPSSSLRKKFLGEISGLKPFPVLNTSRLRLRRIIDSDLESIYEGLSHPEVIRYYGVSYNTLEETGDQMEWYSGLEENGTGIWWAVCYKDHNTFLGACGFNNLSNIHYKAEIGFWLLPEYWGQGIVSEAITEILYYGFETLNLHRIVGFAEIENVNSKKTLSKPGFVHEGTMKDCEIKNGTYISIDIYAIFRPTNA